MLATAATAAPALTVRRTIAASPEVLFDAWLDAKSLQAWLRPGATRSSVKVDARVGGAFEILMHRAHDTVPHTGTYRRIERPSCLEFTWKSPYTQERETLVRVDFAPVGDRTEVIITHTMLPDAAAVSAHNGGWTEALKMLETASA